MKLNHVAIIMDGNGRWATKKNLIRSIGHENGMNVINPIVKRSKQEGVSYLTLYAFSSENWNRPKKEIDFLFFLLGKYISEEIDELHKENVRVSFVGDIEKLSNNALEKIKFAINKTKENTGLTLNIALNYGGRNEIVRACNNLINSGKTIVNEIDFTNELYSTNKTDVDLLIRTGGEKRLSNFLLWQCAYAELYFTDCLWPDYNVNEYEKAIEYYYKKDRRFGGIDENKIDK